MYVEKETEKAYLMVHDAVPFWVQKRWYKNGKLLPAGWKAFRDAKASHWKNLEFDALKEFEVIRETEKAVLVRCNVKSPGGTETAVQFWLPRSMTDNFNFVARKVSEVEAGFPFIGTYVVWSGSSKERVCQ